MKLNSVGGRKFGYVQLSVKFRSSLISENNAGRVKFGYVQQRVKIKSRLEYDSDMAEMM